MHKKIAVLLCTDDRALRGSGSDGMKIKDKYDLLRFIIKHMDKDKREYTIDAAKISEMVKGEDFAQYLTELKAEGCIEVWLGGHIDIHAKADLVLKKQPGRLRSVASRLNGAVVQIVVGVVVALLSAFLIWKLGWG